MSDTSSPETPRAKSNLLIPGAIIVGAIIIGVALVIGLSRGGSGAAQTGTQGEVFNTTKAQMQALIGNITSPVLVDSAHIAAGDPRFIGKKDAPVTMYYWFDYQCPYCKAFEVGGIPQLNSGPNGVAPILPQLITQYVNTGKLKIVFRDFAFLGQDSVTASEYSRAIWDLYPDKWFEWQTAMFDVQDAEGDQGFGNAQTIDTLISLIPGIDVNKVHEQIAAHKAQYDAAIAADMKAGQAIGIQGTPGFEIGKTIIPGFYPLSKFTAAIDAGLK